MATFVNIGPYTIQVESIALVQWMTTHDGILCAQVHFTGDRIPLELAGDRAECLSNVMSAMECRSERDINAELHPAGFSLYTEDETEAEQLDELQARLVLAGPDDAA